MAQEPGEIQDTIWRVLGRNRLALLATQRNGQPHASLIAFTAMEGLRFLAFATYRDTLKYDGVQEDRQAYIVTHLARHPYMERFLSSPDCEFVHVAVHAYQVVSNIDDVPWYATGECAAS